MGDKIEFNLRKRVEGKTERNYWLFPWWNISFLIWFGMQCQHPSCPLKTSEAQYFWFMFVGSHQQRISTVLELGRDPGQPLHWQAWFSAGLQNPVKDMSAVYCSVDIWGTVEIQPGWIIIAKAFYSQSFFSGSRPSSSKVQCNTDNS